MNCSTGGEIGVWLIFIILTLDLVAIMGSIAVLIYVWRSSRGKQ